ncbi:hypothetical protein B9N43_04855 [Denitratisoma sp. DHT3]|uniref:lipase family protein n=1 Tax=Denitratisoma sp. DHT3 TaxID=1981880 RepID=UPI00119873AA|nr:lipase family protein [Denitratisoma sp. DHT3]QDX80632.1 hypothetical protein B9N43_04855 [Denitratisoma sp. DHT3]
MSNAQDYLSFAELALASYSEELLVGRPDSDKLKKAGLSTPQTKVFSDTYTVIQQYNDLDNGLSVTVFKDAEGQRYLAIRGSDDGYDLATDLVSIALLGSTKYQSQYASLKAKVDEWIDDGTLPSSFTVTGHSLGGFLAAGIAADYSSKVSHAYLYNAPGLGGIAATLLAPFDALRDALGIGATTLNPGKVSNIKAETGASPIAGLGKQVAPEISIAIEDQTASDVDSPPAARNHSQQVLTDALALYAVYAKLAPGLDTETFSALLKSFTHSNHLSLETGLEQLSNLLLNRTEAIPSDRNDFYTHLYSLQDSVAYSSLIGGTGNGISWRITA